MSSVLLIQKVVEYERKLQMEEEARKYRLPERYAQRAADPDPCREEKVSLFARIFGSGQKRQAESPCR